MKRSSKTLIVFSCIFVTIAVLFLGGESLFIATSCHALFKPDADIGDAIGGIFIYIYAILLAGGAIVSSIISLPFEIPLFKLVGKKWYNIVLLAVSIATILAAVGMVFILPTASSMAEAARSSSSSSSVQA